MVVYIYYLYICIFIYSQYFVSYSTYLYILFIVIVLLCIYRGDTAIYLLFAYARVTSILRKAKDDKNIDIADPATVAAVVPTYDHPAGMYREQIYR